MQHRNPLEAPAAGNGARTEGWIQPLSEDFLYRSPQLQLAPDCFCWVARSGQGQEHE